MIVFVLRQIGRELAGSNARKNMQIDAAVLRCKEPRAISINSSTDRTIAYLSWKEALLQINRIVGYADCLSLKYRNTKHIEIKKLDII